MVDGLTDFTVVSCEDKKADWIGGWIREEYVEEMTSYLITCHATNQIWHQNTQIIRRYATKGEMYGQITAEGLGVCVLNSKETDITRFSESMEDIAN